MGELVFHYSAISLFTSGAGFEILVTEIKAHSIEDALSKALIRMEQFAIDFSLEFSGIVNVYEGGTDMRSEYGEVFSLTCRRDANFETRFLDKLKSPIGIRSGYVDRSKKQ